MEAETETQIPQAESEPSADAAQSSVAEATPQAGGKPDGQVADGEIKKLRKEAQSLRERLRALEEKAKMDEARNALQLAAMREGVEIEPLLPYLAPTVTAEQIGAIIEAVKKANPPKTNPYIPELSPTAPPKQSAALSLDEIKNWSTEQVRARWDEVQEVLKRSK